MWDFCHTMTDIVGARIPIKGQMVSAEISQFYESDLCQVATICVRRLQIPAFFGSSFVDGSKGRASAWCREGFSGSTSTRLLATLLRSQVKPEPFGPRLLLKWQLCGNSGAVCDCVFGLSTSTSVCVCVSLCFNVCLCPVVRNQPPLI